MQFLGCPATVKSDPSYIFFNPEEELVRTAILYICLFLSPIVFAEDIIFITADRIKAQSNKFTNSIKFFSNEDIKRSESKTLTELLSKETDLNIVTSGALGSNASLFLRGTDSSHTLVIIDGVVMNDVSNPNRQFNIGHLSLNNIDKIEILKGSQGLIYGSNAIGGVIVITTKKAKSKKTTGEVFADYGTFKTIESGFNIQNKFELINISLGTDYFKTDGFSAADKKFNPNADNDGSKRVTFDLGINTELSKLLTFDFNFRQVQNKSDLDKGGGAGNDDPNDYQKDKEQYIKFQLTKYWEESTNQTQFYYTHSKHNHQLEVLPDTEHPASSSVNTWGEVNTLSLNHTQTLSDKLTENINLDWRLEKDQTLHKNQNSSAFIYHQYELASSIYNFGIRLDHNQVFGNHTTYKIASGYKLNNSLIKISYSTGFRAPSLNQLYDPTYGNHNLVPEISNSSEVSHEMKWSQNLKNESTIFYTKITDRLGYDPITFINRNQGKTEIIGFEEKLQINWQANFAQDLSTTFLKTHQLARRPEATIKNIFSYQIKNQHFIYLEIFYTGKRSDVDNAGNTVHMNSYLISNLNYKYLLSRDEELYLKIHNLFNQEYEEIYGYGTGKIALTFGAHYNF